jgi:hypothetical protein
MKKLNQIPQLGNELPHLQWEYKKNPKTGKVECNSIQLSNREKIDQDALKVAMQRATGSTDLLIGSRILLSIANGLTEDTEEKRMNTASAMLPALKPNDETEAMLLGQFLALHESGMRCLKLANLPSQGFYHEERLFMLANKLLNTANQTMQTVLKYRSKGQQTVQVIHVHNEGQAILTQNLSAPSHGG